MLGFFHESNTFVEGRTEHEDFVRWGILEGDDVRRRFEGSTATMGGFLDAANDLGAELVPLVFAGANPSGIIARDTFERLASLLVSQLEADGPWAGVLLALHGAAVAEGEPDADGEVLRRVRAVVGPHVPIGVALDLHANVSPRMVRDSTIMVLYRSNPHLDADIRGRECAQLLGRAIGGEARPVHALVQIPIAANILCQGTSSPPMADLMDRVAAIERGPGMLSASLAIGYPYADVEEMGMAVVTVADGDRDLARAEAERLAREVWQRRDLLRAEAPSARHALERAVAAPGPVLLLDTGDNIGGGSRGDSIAILREARRMGVPRYLETLCDPLAVRACHAGGEGAELDLFVGARHMSGDGPCALRARVTRLADGRFADSAPTHGGFRDFDTGPTAVVVTDQDQTLVLTSAAAIDSSVERHRSLGIAVASQQVIVAKGVHSPLPSYGPLVQEHLFVGTPGPTSADLSTFRYERRRRPLFPFETDRWVATAAPGE